MKSGTFKLAQVSAVAVVALWVIPDGPSGTLVAGTVTGVGPLPGTSVEGKPLRVGQPTAGTGRGARVCGDARCPGQPIHLVARSAHGQPGRQRPVQDVAGAQGVNDLDVRNRDFGAAGAGQHLDRQRATRPRDRRRTQGADLAQHVIIRAPGDLVQVGGNAEDGGDQGDVDMYEQLLKSGLP